MTNASERQGTLLTGLVKTQGIALHEVARQLGVSTLAMSKIIKRADSFVNIVNNAPILPHFTHEGMDI